MHSSSKKEKVKYCLDPVYFFQPNYGADFEFYGKEEINISGHAERHVFELLAVNNDIIDRDL